jgi:hypothetical protein
MRFPTKSIYFGCCVFLTSRSQMNPRFLPKVISWEGHRFGDQGEHQKTEEMLCEAITYLMGVYI